MFDFLVSFASRLFPFSLRFYLKALKTLASDFGKGFLFFLVSIMTDGVKELIRGKMRKLC